MMNIIELIGNTPLVELKGLDTGVCKLYAKLENQNPGGSIKDRIGLSMIKDAEERGQLKPGGTIVEATAGNTGLGLALIAALKGYRLVIVMPDKMSREKMAHLRALGAEVVMTRSDVPKGHPEYYHEYAERLSKEIPGAWYANQFENPANPKAHEETTGPEIWEQSGHAVDAIVLGVGSGGTIGGLTKYFKKVAPHVEMILADPVGSILTHYVETGEISKDVGSWIVEGIGEDFIPIISDFSMCKKSYAISDKDSLLTARELLRTNGIFGGSSTGTLLAAALRYCKDQTTPKNVVTFVCDSGNKYLSKMFNDFWMMDQGFLPRSDHGDLRDLISYSHEKGATVTLKPEETLLSALGRMKVFDVSQLPVLEGKKIVGIIDESDVLVAVSKDKKAFSKSVKSVMTSSLKTIHPKDSLEKVPELFKQGLVAIVADEDQFYGIITRIDFLNYLRAKTDNETGV